MSIVPDGRITENRIERPVSQSFRVITTIMSTFQCKQQKCLIPLTRSLAGKLAEGNGDRSHRPDDHVPNHDPEGRCPRLAGKPALTHQTLLAQFREVLLGERERQRVGDPARPDYAVLVFLN